MISANLEETVRRTEAGSTRGNRSLTAVALIDDEELGDVPRGRRGPTAIFLALVVLHRRFGGAAVFLATIPLDGDWQRLCIASESVEPPEGATLHEYAKRGEAHASPFAT